MLASQEGLWCVIHTQVLTGPNNEFCIHDDLRVYEKELIF
jgi:hypothetical protein